MLNSEQNNERSGVRAITEPVLTIRGLTKPFDALVALDDVSLTVERGSITGLIGPNGAGKSTLFNTVVGDVKPDTGSIEFNGKPVQGLTPDNVFRHGLARTFQIPQPFPEMTVLDNLMLSAPSQLGEKFWAPWFRQRQIQQQESVHLQQAHDVLEFTTLDKVAHLAAANLSGGQQKLLELARVLMSKPDMIMLDEPAAGVNPSLTQLLIEKIHQLNRTGITFLIIEHNMDLVMHHCDRIVALANGRIIFDGTATDAQASEQLLDSYLGHAGVGS